MEEKKITPVAKLSGIIPIAGAKNSALLLLAASALSNDLVVIENLPRITDVMNMCNLLEILGVRLKWLSDTDLSIDASKIQYRDLNISMVGKTRTSILFMGVLLGRFGRVSLRSPGGCKLGPRPIDLHIEAMRQMGAKIELEGHCVVGGLIPQLEEKTVKFERVTVTGTANALLCAIMQKQDVTLHNCAMEPEIDDLIAFLRMMGASIRRIGSTIVTRGGTVLKGGLYRVMSDRMEAGTFLIAAAILGGKVKVGPVEPYYLEAVLERLKAVGAKIKVHETCVELEMNQRPQACDIVTGEYPKFPTDLQPQWCVLAAVSKGESQIVDTVYPERFDHMPQLAKMGVDYQIIENGVIISGIDQLRSATLVPGNLRAAAALALAAMAAKDTSIMLNVEHLYRGYAEFFSKIRAVVEA